MSISPRTVGEVREEEAAEGNPCGPALPDCSAPRGVTAYVHQRDPRPSCQDRESQLQPGEKAPCGGSVGNLSPKLRAP